MSVQKQFSIANEMYVVESLNLAEEIEIIIILSSCIKIQKLGQKK